MGGQRSGGLTFRLEVAHNLLLVVSDLHIEATLDWAPVSHGAQLGEPQNYLVMLALHVRRQIVYGQPDVDLVSEVRLPSQLNRLRPTGEVT